MGLPRNNQLVPYAHELLVRSTPEENKLWFLFLRNYKVPFCRQKIIGPFIVDFFSNKVRISIELDGSQHYEEKQKKKDTYRTRYIEMLEVKELRFSNHDIWTNFDGVCEVIDREVQKRRNDIVEIPLSLLKSKS